LKGLLEIDLAPAVVRPRIYRLSSPPQIFEKATVEKLLESVNRSTTLGRRDYAMLLLAARYGLRSSDIRKLRLDDIHWREQRIVLIQSKTQQRLELPLLADVDEALTAYLQHARPSCKAREIFLRHKRPIAPFSNGNSHWAVMARALRSAGITGCEPRRGFHLLRHHADSRIMPTALGDDEGRGGDRALPDTSVGIIRDVQETRGVDRAGGNGLASHRSASCARAPAL
jgi:integrase